MSVNGQFDSVSLPRSILDLLEGATLMKYSNFVSSSILAYDYLLTVSDEVRLIWPWEWRAGKILYIATRYAAYVDSILYLVFWLDKDLSTEQCELTFNIACWVSSAGIAIAQWILGTRTYAIWGKSRLLLVSLTVMLLAIQGTGFYAVNTFIKSLNWTLSPFPTVTRCYILVSEHNLLFVIYILIMFAELVILSLTFWKGFSQWRISRSNLIKVLYRDGVLYFAVLFAVSVVNFALCVINAPILREFLLIQLQRVLHSVCTSRIILNLREASMADTSFGVGVETNLTDAANTNTGIRSSVYFNNSLHRYGAEWPTNDECSTNVRMDTLTDGGFGVDEVTTTLIDA